MDGIRVPYVAWDLLAIQALEAGGWRSGQDQAANGVALPEQLANHDRTDEARPTRDENAHLSWTAIAALEPKSITMVSTHQSPLRSAI